MRTYETEVQDSDGRTGRLTVDVATIDAGLAGGAVATAVCIGMHYAYLYRNHFWYDNVCHLLAGFAIGTAISRSGVSRRQGLAEFLAIATGWECFEYLIGEFPWDGTACLDYACEDTMLDTVMGLAGVWLAFVASGRR